MRHTERPHDSSDNKPQPQPEISDQFAMILIGWAAENALDQVLKTTLQTAHLLSSFITGLIG